MNVDFAAIGGTAWTVGGSMIIACTNWSLFDYLNLRSLTKRPDYRWCNKNWSNFVSRVEKRCICQRCSKGDPKGCSQCFWPPSQTWPEFSLESPDRRSYSRHRQRNERHQLSVDVHGLSCVPNRFRNLNGLRNFGTASFRWPILDTSC